MELKRISIKNFLSYYDENEIEFADTTTIVIGQNNTGKSKLFDAINFALYGRIFSTDKGENGEWISIDKEIAPLVLNIHMKNLALKNDEEQIEAKVELEVDNGSIIIIERSYIYKKDGDNFAYVDKRFLVTECDKLDGHVTFTDTSEGAADRLERYFPSSIKNFFLFQGEAVSKIMQLRKGGNFSTSVEQMARLSVFKKAMELAETYSKHIHNLIARETNKNKFQHERQESLQAEINSNQTLLEEYEDKKSQAEKELSEYTDHLEKIEAELSELSEFEQWFKQKKALEENSKMVNEELKRVSSERTEIAENAVFYKVKDKIAEFKEFYSKLEKKGEVPPSIPVAEIKKALKYCRCTICNSDLSEGTEGRRFAENRIPKCDTDKLGSYLRELNSTFGDASEEILRIPENLSEIILKKRRLEERRNNLIKQKDDVDKLLAQIKLEDSHSEATRNHIDELRRSVINYRGFIDKASREKYKNEARIENTRSSLSNLRHQLSSLIDDDDDVDESLKIKNSYAEKLSTAMNTLYTVAKNTAYNEVQKRANEYYKEMTKENKALTGSLKIDTESSEIYTVDENGVRIPDMNTGNRISIQLAVIAGILTVANEEFGQLYPFVTDAPVSALGGDNKLSTIKTMIDKFEQSIIIIKDDTSSKNKATDEIRSLIQSDVAIAYELSLSKDEGGVLDQYTVVKRIKG